MKNLLPNLLIVLGFCVGTIGATGFHSPADSANVAGVAESPAPGTEQYAWVFLVGGVVLLGAGALLGRGARVDAHAGGKSGAVAAIREELVEIQSLVAGLDDVKDSLENAQLMARIEDMRTGILFDLGSRSDSFASQIGFDAYAHVWGDFATCERLLNRCWSMAADGHGEESREELPLARAAIDSAVESCATLV